MTVWFIEHCSWVMCHCEVTRLGIPRLNAVYYFFTGSAISMTSEY